MSGSAAFRVLLQPVDDALLVQLSVVATKVMEKLIAKKLCCRLDLDLNEHENWTLVDYVDHAKKVHK